MNLTSNRVTIFSETSDSGLPEHDGPNSHGAVEHLAIHQRDSNIELELEQRQLLLLLVKNEGVDQGQVKEMVQNPPVPFLGLGFQPAKKSNNDGK